MDHLSMLTVRERECYLLVAKGLSRREIAGRLGITEKTVKNTLVAAYRSTGVTNAVGCCRHVYRITD
jgi:DNA-binding CsgD family transcriptional regulator